MTLDYCFLLFFATSVSFTLSHVHHKYCIIGAGPSGLQLGYFFKRAQRDYIIFESGNSPGTFFKTYPRHGTLISINKRFTGETNKEFNLRHDWNSLLSDDEELTFTRYTDEYFPKKDVYVRYLNDYQKKLQIKVQFHTTIRNIRKSDTLFLMNDQHGTTYSCDVLILATGIAIPNKPKSEGINNTVGYEEMSLNREDYAGKSVMILGTGNTAFETATHIYGYTNYIHFLSRSRVRLAWATHYVGDLRAINNEPLDSYMLKSLEGIAEVPVDDLIFKKSKTGKVYFYNKHFRPRTLDEKLGILETSYDYIIRCTGWKFDYQLLDKSIIPEHLHYTLERKYPPIGANYESKYTENLFIAGTASHSLDWRKSAGGFVHGFRYTTRALFRILESRFEEKPWSEAVHPIANLLDHFTRRVNEASGIYQMFSALSEVAILSKDRTTYQYVEEFPVKLLSRLQEVTKLKVEGSVIAMVYQYGQNFSGPAKDLFYTGRATGNLEKPHTSNFLHPVYYYFNRLPTDTQFENKGEKEVFPKPDNIHHTIEDFKTVFRGRNFHTLPFQRFLEEVTGQDLTNYSAERCLQLGLSSSVLPAACQDGIMNPTVPRNMFAGMKS